MDMSSTEWVVFNTELLPTLDESRYWIATKTGKVYNSSYFGNNKTGYFCVGRLLRVQLNEICYIMLLTEPIHPNLVETNNIKHCDNCGATITIGRLHWSICPCCGIDGRTGQLHL